MHLRALIRHSYDVNRRAALLWYHRSADALSATVSYYMIFAITPFLLLVITFMSYLYGQAFVTAALTEWGKVLGPEMIQLLSVSVNNLEVLTNGYTVPLVGVLFFSGMVVVLMNTITNGINSLWGIRRAGILVWVKKCLRSIVFTLVLVLYFIALLAGNKLITLVTGGLPAPLSAGIYILFFLVLTTALFTEAFYILPVRSPNRYARVRGGLMISVMLYFLKSFVTLYLLTTPAPGLFGTAGLILVFLIWSYASAAVVFYGAALAYAIDPVQSDPYHDDILSA